ncbi:MULTISPECIES: HIT family protein [Snodgrassella]|uniref:HIT family protein n=1 Tax=Snodgrassella TaxID=1193515 RepID=UPI000C1E287C|nr:MULTISPECIES: HIT family protein [Snodgrassella]MBI0068375.1 HIT family protein [Snodgrassella sp. M0110]MBI0077699.1 HIT family protein [Snodgrassella sp. M0118]MBI0079670.1 HIT family protein [Snodgrassella sp. M0112]PIT30811.1 HIT family hydrolase [Snodgrassella alvi]PIT32102.1 HIT family hydrolase [Snodgrassella alvi]
MQQYDSNNIFARIIRGEIPCHKVYEDEQTLAFMDVMPQARGHVLVIPKCEAIELTDIPQDYLAAVFSAAKKIINAQRKVLHRNGVVQLQLSGEQAGQSVFHYHIHLIPGHIHELGKHESVAADQAELAQLAAQLRAELA